MKTSWLSKASLSIAIISIITGIFLAGSTKGFEFLSPYELGRNFILILLIIAIMKVVQLTKDQITNEASLWKFFLFGAITNTTGSILKSIEFVVSENAKLILVRIYSILFLLTYLCLIIGLILAIKYMIGRKKESLNFFVPITLSVLLLCGIITFLVPSMIGFEINIISKITIHLFLSFDIILFILTIMLLGTSFKSNLFPVFGFISFSLIFLTSYHFIQFFIFFTGSIEPIHLSILRIFTMTLFVIAVDIRLHLGKDAGQLLITHSSKEPNPI